MPQKTKATTKPSASVNKKAIAKPAQSRPKVAQMAPSEQLQQIDRQLLELLVERVKVTQAASEQAKAEGKHLSLVDHQSRCATLASEVASSNHLTKNLVIDWMKHTASICQHEVQLTQPIAYLGPIYSYSYLAAVKHFGQAASLVPVATIAASSKNWCAVKLRLESYPSRTARMVASSIRSACSPAGLCTSAAKSFCPSITACSGRCPRGEITEIYSKPQALSQCRGWLSHHVPDARLIEIASTAAAARLAADKQGAAAIASFEAGVHHGLEVIDENIEDNSHNMSLASPSSEIVHANHLVTIKHRSCSSSNTSPARWLTQWSRFNNPKLISLGSSRSHWKTIPTNISSSSNSKGMRNQSHRQRLAEAR